MRKKLLTILGIAVLCIASYAANYMQVNTTDGKKIVYAMDDVEKVKFDTINYSYSYVDLGLPSGTLWATFNIGATKPEEMGDYFAWGETEPKEEYNSNSYKYATEDWKSFLKYNFGSYGYPGTIDSLSILLPEDDAATANWGSEWRMPTYEEQKELLEECEYSWVEGNGMYGAKFTAKNGNSLFFPAAGDRQGSGYNDLGSRGNYWSSSLDVEYEDVAHYLILDKKGADKDCNEKRFVGFSVRAVRVKK